MLQRIVRAVVPALAGLALLAVSAAAQTIKIGVILTYSGPFAQVGDEIDKGLKLYIKEHEKELPAGVKLELGHAPLMSGKQHLIPKRIAI